MPRCLHFTVAASAGLTHIALLAVLTADGVSSHLSSLVDSGHVSQPYMYRFEEQGIHMLWHLHISLHLCYSTIERER